jgi:hypothetical protein
MASQNWLLANTKCLPGAIGPGATREYRRTSTYRSRYSGDTCLHSPGYSQALNYEEIVKNGFVWLKTSSRELGRLDSPTGSHGRLKWVRFAGGFAGHLAVK